MTFKISAALLSLILLLPLHVLAETDTGAAAARSTGEDTAKESATAEPAGPQGSAASQPKAEKTTLKPVRATYTASLEKGIPIEGSATRTLEQREDGLWEYRFDVDSFIADIDESLLLKWNGYQVIPLEYRYRLSGFLVPDRSAKLDFDWKRNRVLNDVEGQPWYMDIHKGVLDKLGFQLQLRQDLKAGETRMVYEIADGGKLKEYEFRVIGERRIDTKNHGTVDTILVEKVREPYKKRETHLWFAPAWDYLLVRMVQIENDGTRYEINLEEADLPNRHIE